uniref:DNA-directed DNA polymerase n=1 Tax=Heterorhabditis bacteriophora TaxID=37862 RepID=A0A1I7WQW5_HETBA
MYLLGHKVNDTEDYIRQEGQRLRTPATTLITPPRAFYRPTEIRDTDEIIKILEFNNPIYVGFSILELSKYLMYEFHYNVMKSIYNDKIRICHQDTDSLIYEIETEDIYKDMGKMKEHFDFSDYPKIILFKWQNYGRVYCIKPKQYTFKVDDGKSNKKSKDVKKYVIKKLAIDDYKRCLFENKLIRKEQYIIRAQKHQVYTIKRNKVNIKDILGNKYDTLYQLKIIIKRTEKVLVTYFSALFVKNHKSRFHGKLNLTN